MADVHIRIPEKENDVMLETPSYKILGRSDFVRQAIAEKVERENEKFLLKRKRELQEELESIYEIEKSIHQKNEDKAKLSDKEILFFLESDKILAQRPEVIDFRIRLYIQEFRKTYNLSKGDFYSLIEEARTQEAERHIFQKVLTDKDKEKKKELSEALKNRIEKGKKVLIELQNSGFFEELKNCDIKKIETFRAFREKLLLNNLKFDISELDAAKMVFEQEIQQ